MRERTTKRQLNKKLLRKWIDAHQPGGKEKLVAGCGYRFSVAAIDKWFQRDGAPGPLNRTRIVEYTGIPMDALFPVVKRKAT